MTSQEGGREDDLDSSQDSSQEGVRDSSQELAYPPVSPVLAGLMGRCPRCGKGGLFQGYLALAPRCERCGLDYSFIDAGDGPAIFVMLIAGFIVVGGALWVEVNYQPPLWVHALIWLPLGLAVPLLMLRPFKGVLVAMQYHTRAAEGRPESDET